MVLFANYQPQAVYTVPAGRHATCTAPECIYRRGELREAFKRYIGPGGQYVVVDRTAATPRGRAEHLECNTHAFEALTKTGRTDPSVPEPKGESSTG